MAPITVAQTSERQEQALRAELIGALRQFVEDHEATEFFCAGLNAAWLRARAVLMRVEGGR